MRGPPIPARAAPRRPPDGGPGQPPADDGLSLFDDLGHDLAGRLDFVDETAGLAGLEGVFLNVVALASRGQLRADLVAELAQLPLPPGPALDEAVAADARHG